MGTHEMTAVKRISRALNRIRIESDEVLTSTVADPPFYRGEVASSVTEARNIEFERAGKLLKVWREKRDRSYALAGSAPSTFLSAAFSGSYADAPWSEVAVSSLLIEQRTEDSSDAVDDDTGPGVFFVNYHRQPLFIEHVTLDISSLPRLRLSIRNQPEDDDND